VIFITRLLTFPVDSFNRFAVKLCAGVTNKKYCLFLNTCQLEALLCKAIENLKILEAQSNPWCEKMRSAAWLGWAKIKKST